MFNVYRMATRAILVLFLTLAMIIPNVFVPGQVLAAPVPPSLRTAQSFAVLGGSTVTNTGSSVIHGDLGLYPGTSITGNPNVVAPGTIYTTCAVAQQAQVDANAAYTALANMAPTQNLTGQDLSSMTLTSGVYKFDSSAQLTGTLTLNAENNSSAFFVFQIGSTLTTASGSSVVVINEPENWCNKYWQVGSSATLGTGTQFQGNILALTSITLNTHANLYGRALALNGAVTMDDNDIDVPICATSTTTQLSATSITLGQSVTDTATVTGLGYSSPNPSGTVTFQVSTDNMITFNPFGTTKTLTSGSATSDSYTPTSAGTYYFRAVYGEHLSFAGSQSGNSEEPLTVGKVSSNTTTLLSATSINLGQSVTDTATVVGSGGNSPIPTGTVIFQVSTDNMTTFSPFGATKTLDSSGNAVSDSYTPALTGSYFFRALYSGDANYSGSQSGNSDEPLTVHASLIKTSTTTTQLSALSITLGDYVNDTATVIGAGGNSPVPTGTIIFQVSTDGGTTFNAFGDEEDLDGSGNATSDSYTPTATGTTYFRAVYSGDSVYSGSQSGNMEEPLLVTSQASPGLSLTKAVTPDNYTQIGDVLTYTLIATNTGDVTLENVTISDPELTITGSTPAQPATLAPGATLTVTGTRTIDAQDICSGSLLNTATAEGTPPTGAPVSDTASATATYTQQPCILLSLTKTVCAETYSYIGELLTYTIVATNGSNVTLSAVSISDPGLTITGSTPAQPATLAPGATLTVTGTRTIDAEDICNGSILNTATAVGTPPTGAPVSATASATATLAIPPNPSISLTKTVTPLTYNLVGNVLTYTLVATNSGNVALSGVAIIDTGLTITGSTPAQPATLAPGQILRVTGTRTITQGNLDCGSLINTATVSGIPPSGAAVCDTASVTATSTAIQTPCLSLTKTVNPLTYTNVGTVLTYTLTATNSGNVTLSAVAITDPGLTVTGSTPIQPATLTPGSTLRVTGTRTVSQSDINRCSLVNTATAAGTSPASVLVSATASATATFAAYQSPAFSGGGGGGGSPLTPVINAVTTSGFSGNTGLNVNTSGIVQAAVRLQVTDDTATLDIPKDTRLTNSASSALTTLSAAKLVTLPDPLPAQALIVTAYDFGPEGAQFSPAITLTVSYDPLSLPGTVDGSEVTLAFWNGSMWVSVESTVDTATHTATAQITHFSKYALLVDYIPAQVPIESVTTPASPEPTVSAVFIPEIAIAGEIPEKADAAEIPETAVAAALPVSNTAIPVLWVILSLTIMLAFVAIAMISNRKKNTE